ncbi:hypothetical protein U746_2559 [Mycolicibacterium mucogenicum 261Sha1.1M5]|nr:hypothetical protein U746_2559 [Mycolicibacterium mucogenicum 261Sha1.1M5]
MPGPLWAFGERTPLGRGVPVQRAVAMGSAVGMVWQLRAGRSSADPIACDGLWLGVAGVVGAAGWGVM